MISCALLVRKTHTDNYDISILGFVRDQCDKKECRQTKVSGA